MLIKKELELIPVLGFPKTTKKEQKGCSYAAAAHLFTLKKCGTVLVVDIFNIKDRGLKLRFFCDGTNYLVCDNWLAVKWLKKKPENILGRWSGNVASTKKDNDLVTDFLKNGLRPHYHYESLFRSINGFVSVIYSEKQDAAMHRKYAKREEHFAMYPAYPNDLPEFCEKHVFAHTYIFISKAEKNIKNAVCGHCRHEFKVNSTEAMPGRPTKCPKCSMKAKFRGLWASAPRERTKICIAHNVDGQLLLRWTEVERTYAGTESRYGFDDYYRNLYLHTPKGNVIYAYRYFNNMGWGWDWFRKKNGDVNYEKTHIYTENLNEVFGNPYYHVDLQAGLNNVREIVFPRLLDNLKNTDSAEYLFKMGLSTLAANLHAENLRKGTGFTEVMGVSRQYLPLYRKCNVDIYEHRVIQASKTWVSAENLEKFRDLKPQSHDITDIIDLLEGMSFERFVNYFTKQKALISRKLSFILTQYKDYISMSESLKVDLSRKSVRFPKNIKQSHDLILHRFNEVKHEIEEENFKQAVEKLYAGMSEFKKGAFCIIFPQLRSELISEGQSLNHCVGVNSYYKNHIKGTRMIFFVRKAVEPQKPFFTMEIDMRELKIRQLYGFGDCSPPSDVRQFANEFLRRLKPVA